MLVCSTASKLSGYRIKLAAQQIVRRANQKCNKLCTCRCSRATGALHPQGEAEGIGLFQPAEERTSGGSNNSLPITVKTPKMMKPGSLLRCTEGEGEMTAIRWRRGGSRGSDFDYKDNWTLAQGASGVSALGGFQDPTALSNLARTQHWPFLEQKVGLETSWGPLQPKGL